MAVATWRKGVAEFIGAFTLIFIGAGAIISTGGDKGASDRLLIALAHGLAIGVMASALAHVSGGHFNPAVTLGALVGRQISLRLSIVYWVSQLLGATVAAVALLGVFPAAEWQTYHLGTPALGPAVGWGTAILVEAILTFFLAFVVYGTGIDPKGSFNAVGGLAIGLTLSLDLMMARPLTGAAMNRARWFGPPIVAQFCGYCYVSWIGPFIGALVACLFDGYVSLW